MCSDNRTCATLQTYTFFVVILNRIDTAGEVIKRSSSSSFFYFIFILLLGSSSNDHKSVPRTKKLVLRFLSDNPTQNPLKFPNLLQTTTLHSTRYELFSQLAYKIDSSPKYFTEFTLSFNPLRISRRRKKRKKKKEKL